jgi:hypothetical protein
MGSLCLILREEHLARLRCFPTGAPEVGSRDPAREILPLDCDSRAGFSLANEPA